MNIAVPIVLVVAFLIVILLDRRSKIKNRLKYLGAVLLALVIMISSSFFFIGSAVGLVLNFAVFTVGLIYFLLATCHRLRDLGHSRWFLALIVVPIVNILLLLYCLLFPSKEVTLGDVS